MPLIFVQTLSLGIYQDFQKEGEIGKKDQAEQTNAQLDQIQD